MKEIGSILIIVALLVALIIIVAYIIRKKIKQKDLDMLLSEEVSTGHYSVESIEREKEKSSK